MQPEGLPSLQDVTVSQLAPQVVGTDARPGGAPIEFLHRHLGPFPEFTTEFLRQYLIIVGEAVIGNGWRLNLVLVRQPHLLEREKVHPVMVTGDQHLFGSDRDQAVRTHGLVAVAPEEMLIARHHDWVHFFPFEKMGLSNKYKVQPPTITDYGFTYNDEILAKKLGGKLWEGAQMAVEE